MMVGFPPVKRHLHGHQAMPNSVTDPREWRRSGTQYGSSIPILSVEARHIGFAWKLSGAISLTSRVELVGTPIDGSDNKPKKKRHAAFSVQAASGAAVTECPRASTLNAALDPMRGLALGGVERFGP